MKSRIATHIIHLFWGGQNECSPRIAALCAALAAIALALCACAQPPPPQPTPLTATPSPAPPNLAIPTPTTQPSAAIPPIAARQTPSPTPADAPLTPRVAAPAPAAQPTPAPTPAPPTMETASADGRPTPAPSAPPASPPADIAFTRIAVGKNHACGLRENGIALCWGNPDALDAPAQTAFIQISAGLNFTCGLRQDSTVACWGDNSGGQSYPWQGAFSDDNSHGQPTRPQGAFSEITAGRANACALPMPQDSPPELLCWGVKFPNGAETLSLNAPISDIQFGAGSVCGLTPQGDMACLSITSQRLAEFTPGPFTQLAAGLHHICALRDDGSALCQGENNAMQASPPPTKFTHIAAGLRHSCGITQASRIECWGSGLPGAPGERLAAPDGEFIAISIGWRNSCALRPNGSAVCWRTPDVMQREIANLPNSISLAFGGAKFNAPVDIFPLPSGGFAVVERNGIITARHDRPDAPPPQTILDLTRAVICCQGETGMLSAALDPQFQDFPFLYIWYTTIADAENVLGEGAAGYGRSRTGRLARFRVERGIALKNSELPILEIPLNGHRHLGGAVRFGADGMLYLGIGDNSAPADAQALNSLRGKIIRIDARGANAERPYRVPPDNPFVDAPGALPEIWAYGLRNPWRMAFDPKNPVRLFVADVGNQTREEVSIATAGANLGWPLCEGDVCREWVDPADLANLAPPAVAYGRDIGCAIIGGVTVPWLDDAFIFGDLCARRVWLLERDSAPAGAQTWRMREIADIVDAARSILAFGATDDGSVYILTYTGPILRLDPTLADNLPDE